MKGSEAHPTSCTFHRCLDPGTFRSNIDSKTYQIWRSPQVPKASKCEVSENVSETGCQSTKITISLFHKQAKHAKVHKASLKTTFTPLNNTNPSPTRHTHQDHSLSSHNPPSHTNNTTHHPPTKMSLPQPPPQPLPSLSSLPEELSALIILALPIPALAALSQTNRKFRRLCNWKLEAPRREFFKRIVTCPISDLWPDPWEMNRRI